MSRWPIVFVMLGLLASGLAYDQVVDMPLGGTVVSTERVIVSPSIADPPRLDGAWYCPVGSSEPGGLADHVVNISNLGDEPAIANLSIITDEGPGPGRRIEIPPKTTERVKLSDTQVVRLAGAVVEIAGGQTVVGHSVTTAQGVAEGPCATSASSSWYFAAGRTTRDSKQYLALMNPFPETAVFDVEFQAVGRSREPGPLQGAFVEARSVRIIDVGEFVAREEALATKITTNRGRLVVERLQVVDGQLGASGASLQLGVPQPARSWIFTAGRIHEGGDDLLTIFNPYEIVERQISETDSEDEDEESGDQESDADSGVTGDPGAGLVGSETDREGFLTVAVELWPTNPTDLSNYSVVTIEREVRPGTFVTIDLQAQAERFEFPLPYELGVNVTSDGLPIVAERWQFASELLLDGPGGAIQPDAEESAEGVEGEPPAEGEQTAEGEPVEELELQPAEPVDSLLPQPIPTVGISTSRGNELFSTRWVVPWVTMTGDSTLIAVASIDEAAIEVRVLSGGELQGPIRATVPAGGRAIIPVTAIEGGAAVEVISTTDAPISVEAVVVLPDLSLDVVPAVPTVPR